MGEGSFRAAKAAPRCPVRPLEGLAGQDGRSRRVGRKRRPSSASRGSPPIRLGAGIAWRQLLSASSVRDGCPAESTEAVPAEKEGNPL